MNIRSFFVGACGALLLTALAPTSEAQLVLVDEDFESGEIPTTWTMLATVPVTWRVTTPGDCNQPSRMLAYNRGDACTYWHSFSTGGLMYTPHFQLVGSRALLVEFDAALELDLGPDTFEVRLETLDGSVAPLVLANTADFPNDGTLNAYRLFVADPSAYANTDLRVVFAFNADNQGNLGVGLLMDNLTVSLAPPGKPFCFGDGALVGCPCGNHGANDEGCSNSTGVGCRLEGDGSSVLALDNLTLLASGARPNQVGMLVQGESMISLPFRDGILCTGNPTERVEVVQIDAAGNAQTSASLANVGVIQAGDQRVYQLWYRDPNLSPCGTGSNLSNALQVTWI